MAERRSRSIRSSPGIRWWGWSVDRSAPATGCRPGEMLQPSCSTFIQVPASGPLGEAVWRRPGRPNGRCASVRASSVPVWFARKNVGPKQRFRLL